MEEALSNMLSNIQDLLRKAGARMREALVETMAGTLDGGTGQEARRFFEHRGNYSPGK